MDKHKDRSKDSTQEPPKRGDRNRNDFDSIRNEEFAAELTSDDYKELNDSEEVNEGPTTVYGWIAIALSAISFFVMPIILGAAGIILGFVSRSRGANTLGNIAIAAGAISILFSVFLIPLI